MFMRAVAHSGKLHNKCTIILEILDIFKERFIIIAIF